MTSSIMVELGIIRSGLCTGCTNMTIIDLNSPPEKVDARSHVEIPLPNILHATAFQEFD